jgi:hypothetical protein
MIVALPGGFRAERKLVAKHNTLGWWAAKPRAYSSTARKCLVIESSRDVWLRTVGKNIVDLALHTQPFRAAKLLQA